MALATASGRFFIACRRAAPPCRDGKKNLLAPIVESGETQMNDTLRLICLAVLGFSLLMLYQNWQEREINSAAAGKAPLTSVATGVPSQPASPAVSDVPAITQPLQAERKGSTDLPAASLSAAAGNTNLIRVETDWLQAAISESGGNLVEVGLKKHLLNGTPYPLLESDQREYIAQSGLIGANDIPNHNSRFTLVNTPPQSLSGDAESLTVDVRAATGEVELTKRYIFHRTDYVVSVLLRVRNIGDSEKVLHGYYQLAHDGLPPRGYSSLLPTFFGAAMYTEADKFVKFGFDDIGSEPYPRKQDNGWLGIIQRYFAVVWLPQAGDREFFMRKNENGGVRLGVISPFGALAAGSEKTVTAGLFVGAEEQDVLNRLHDSNEAPGIQLVVDYGWLTFIAVLLFEGLAIIHSFVGNWGVAIILLTIAVKLLFYPLSSAAYRSMAKMKEEAPRIKQLQEKHANDKQRMQQEMMALYREKKINPLGGCLPILVQIPVFIALYWVLLGSVELREAPFFLWIQDLSTPDPFFILSFIMGASMFLQTRLSPAPPDPTQAMIMRIMPIGFALFSVFFPSGLVLYWAVNTILSIAQQWHITRRLQQAKK